MQLKILAPQWGFEHLPFEDFLIKIKTAGFDGIDTWLPEDKEERKKFIRLLEQHQLPVVAHQHQASGINIRAFCSSFEYYLELALECDPILINSHSGRDYFSLNDQLRVIDVASEFAAKNNIRVAHETHRGRLGFSPYNAEKLFKKRPEMKVTADFSHWACVTESYLQHCPDIVNEAIKRAEHIHARVGYPEGPQVPDPRVPEWQEATNIFMNWWMQIIDEKGRGGYKEFTITPEFGPPPYMVISPETGKPIADQFEINCFMKELIRKSAEQIAIA